LSCSVAPHEREVATVVPPALQPIKALAAG